MSSQETNRNKRSQNQILFNSFLEDYRFILAKTPQEKNKALLLRHEVFLQELHYEMREDQTKNFETDEYDESSIHCLIEHKRSGQLAGCMRLVIPSVEPNSPLSKLPVEVQGDQWLNHESIHPSKLPKRQLCEVSRLAISRNFRSRQQIPSQADGVVAENNFTDDEEKTFPLIAIGLFLCTYSLVGLSGKKHVFAMMEPRLPRLLALSGFHFTQVSETIEYHGARHAYYIDHTKAEKEIHADLMPFYLHIRSVLEPQLEEVLTAKESTSFA